MALPLPSTLRDAFAAERAAATPRAPRTPVLVHVGRAAAKLANHAAKLRTAAMSAAGLGCLDYAAFRFDTIAGWAAVGATLLLLEWLNTDDATDGDG